VAAGFPYALARSAYGVEDEWLYSTRGGRAIELCLILLDEREEGEKNKNFGRRARR
jgi:hypothetical protein